MIHVGPVEVLWIAVNVAGLLVHLWLRREAKRDYEVVLRLNGKAREVAVQGDIRRESVRVVMNAALLVVSVPSVFSAREVTLTLPIAALMAVPFLILANGLLDLRERRLLTALIAKETRR